MKKKTVELNINLILQTLELHRKLPQSDVFALCHQISKIFLKENTLLEITAPLRICGDLHGQFEDLLKIFEKLGKPNQCKYLFLGDYVDRGRKSVETICYLFAYKIKHPKLVFMLRGNHQCSRINKMYGFYQQCIQKYSNKTWKAFCDAFNSMPISALVQQKILCMHGGISPSLVSIQVISKIMRPTQIPQQGLLCDILWSDPNDQHDGWQQNQRGISFTFGKSAVKTFIKKNDIDLIVRGHQVVQQGYQFFGDRKLVTIFSAPNYCGMFDNKGAVLSITQDMVISFQVLKPINKPSGKRVKALKNY